MSKNYQRNNFQQYKAATSNENNNNEARSKISLKRVQDLIVQPQDKILLSIADKTFGLEEYLSAQTMGDNLMIKFLELLNKGFECQSLPTQKIKILDQLINSRFLTELVLDSICRTKHRTEEDDIKLVKYVINICHYVLRINPGKLTSLQNIIDRIEFFVKLRLKNLELENVFDTKIQNLILEIEERKRKINNRSSETDASNSDDLAEPPDSDVAVLPTLNEISGTSKPFLRKNIINGAFNNVEHYLDIHFRLLREDFLQPLRQGIREFVSIINEHKRKKPNIPISVAIKKNEMLKKVAHIEGLRAYMNVKFLLNLCSDNGVSFYMQVDPEKCKNIKWEYSKRLLYGSLVCLSNDYFENNFILAVIIDRDIECLKKGLVKVRIEEDNGVRIDKAFLINDKDNYIMFETTAYFEAYRHVLHALKLLNTQPDDFPFKEHIVDCNNKMKAPDYLVNSYVDLRTLVDPNKKVDFDENTRAIKFEFDPSTNYARYCKIDEESRWPSHEQMNLDISQYEAIKLALNNKITLIQGPAGTGKTFVGVKCLQLLLNNSKLWCGENLERKKPILCVTYTNHALDSFLELCVSECKLTSGIVRVGGRCKNTNLENFLLRKIKTKFREERSLDKSIFYQTKDEQKKLKELQIKINYQISMIELSQKGILKLNALSQFMSDKYVNQLSSDMEFLAWLGFHSSEHVYNDLIEKEKRANNEANNLTNAGTEAQATEETAQVDEEEDLMAEDEDDERLLDEDIVLVKHEDQKKKLLNQILVTDYIEDKNEFIFTEKELLIEFNIKGNDDWIVVGNKEPKNPVKGLLKKIINNNTAKDVDTEDLWNLDFEDRLCLYTHWVSRFKAHFNAEIEKLKDDFNNSLNSLSDLRMQEDKVIMQNAYIIAMTTTGSARYHKILQDIGPRIVIVEEAAEVFEAQIITALSKHCEHLILIGDHVQLKPKPQVYKLEKQYNLNISLFERLIKNNFKYVTLSCQHRMRPEISVLMKHFYNIEIIDHESVKNRPNITGLSQNIAFVSHTNVEENYDDGRSKINRFEVEYLISLAKYLIKQNYYQKQITVLTTYLGQMFLFRERLKHENLKEIRVCTVDNYQGEENDIILLSLVRSNKEEKIGFLESENRICVAFTRARNGFYCVGNFNLLNKTSTELKTKWKSILAALKEKGCINTGILLACTLHPNNNVLAEDPKDFEKRHEGGCEAPCEYRLDCGHTCSLLCHAYDTRHSTIKCMKDCMKQMKCGHKCKKTCSHKGDCEQTDCLERVEKTLYCGHQQLLLCHQNPDNVKCFSICEKKLKCGHSCLKKCNIRPCEPCISYKNMITSCNHKKEIKVACQTQSWYLQKLCDSDCGVQLECEHNCKGKCGECFGGRIHSLCKEKCNRVLVCGHECKTPCAKQCPPCKSQCENRCSHSKCGKRCSMLCTPCREECDWKCEHKACTKLCSEICDREACNEPCPKKLRCKHDCIGFCGEPCPLLCRICDKDKVTEIFFGTEDSPDARFVYLEDCKHVVEAAGMLKWMEDNYNISNAKSVANVIKLPDCPRCKTTIRRNLRYSTYVKHQLKAIEEVKVKYAGTKNDLNKKQEEFLTYLEANKGKVEQNYINTYNEIIDVVIENRYFLASDFIELGNKWKLYFKLVDIEKKNANSAKEIDNLKCLEYETNKIKSALFDTRLSVDQSVSNQFLKEIANEIQRIDMLFQYLKCKEYITARLNNESMKPALNHLMRLEYLLVSKISPFTQIENEINQLLTNLKPHLCGITITNEERVMIVEAMNLQKGHWYKCPNSHVYCITECGGAEQESNCPDCGVRIGGAAHRLLDDNRVATEMDGAEFSAWSEQANMVNFDLNDLN